VLCSAVPTSLFRDDFRESAKTLVTSHLTAPESKLKVVYKKYSSEKLGGVALRPPATEICK
jgi:cyclin B